MALVKSVPTVAQAATLKLFQYAIHIVGINSKTRAKLLHWNECGIMLGGYSKTLDDDLSAVKIIQ